MRFFTASVVLFLLATRLVAEPDDVGDALEKIRDEHEVPALAAAVVDEGKIVALGVCGNRSAKEKVRVTIEDKWHLGSCTKSMTASVAAMLVEDGKIRWDSTVGGIFSGICEGMHQSWRDVTLQQLLVHRAGAPHDPPADLWKVALARKGTATEQRWEFVNGLLHRAPAKPPGTHWIYSDCGYAIAGAMLERVSGKSWEDLLRERLFEPLGLKSAGFGEPASPGQLDQPWGHTG